MGSKLWYKHKIEEKQPDGSVIIKWIDDCEELIENKIKDKNCPECANDPDAKDYSSLNPPKHLRP